MFDLKGICENLFFVLWGANLMFALSVWTLAQTLSGLVRVRRVEGVRSGAPVSGAQTTGGALEGSTTTRQHLVKEVD